MAKPVFVNCAANVWTKVAENIVSGQLHKANKDPNMYLQTYVPTGDAAPTLRSDGVQVFLRNEPSEISDSELIDVYIYADGYAGKIRADL